MSSDLLKRTASPLRGGAAKAKPARERILAAAFEVFTQRGFAAAGTLEIATRARVSKRELYALFGSKQQMLITCISERARRMRLPEDAAAPLRSRRELEAALVEFGSVLLTELSDPDVVALFRLAVAEANRSPEVAQALDVYGRQACAAALREVMEGARSAGVSIDAEVEPLADRFLSLLLDDLPMSLALGLRSRPDKQEIVRRAAEAARAVLGVA